MAKRGRKPRSTVEKSGEAAAGAGNGAATRRGRRGDGESVMGFFRPILIENPKLLKGRNNAALLQYWMDAHPGEDVPKRVKQGLSNVKSQLRKALRKRRGRKAAGAETGEATPAPVVIEASATPE